MKPGPEVRASLSGREVSWSLVAGPRDPRTGVRLLGEGVPDTVGYKVQGVLKFLLAC